MYEHRNYEDTNLLSVGGYQIIVYLTAPYVWMDILSAGSVLFEMCW